MTRVEGVVTSGTATTLVRTVAPTVVLSQSSLTFRAVQNGPVPSPQTVHVGLANPGSNLAYTITGVPTGFAATSSAGTSSGTFGDTVTVTVTNTARPPGTYSGTVTIDPGDPTSANVAIAVSVVVTTLQDSLIIDPGANQIDLMSNPYRVMAFSAPAPALETLMVGSISTEGDRIVARRHQNRPVQMTVEVTGTSRANLETNVLALEQRVAKLVADGGVLQRVSSSSNSRYLDVEVADSYEPMFDQKRFLGNVAEVQIGLQAQPYARSGTLQLFTSASETLQPALVTTFAGAAGDFPALGQLQVQAGNSSSSPNGVPVQSTMWWGLEPYDATLASPLIFDPSNGIQVLTGTVRSANTPADVTALTSEGVFTPYSNGIYSWKEATDGAIWQLLNLGSSVSMRHSGDYRLFARAYATGTQASLKATWSPSFGSPSVDNAWATISTNAHLWRVVDLGIVRPRVSSSNGSWTCTINGSAGTGTTIAIDSLWLMPFSAGYGRLSVPPLSSSSGSPTLMVSGSDAWVINRANAARVEPAAYFGDYFRVPPALRENRQYRLMVKTSSNAIDSVSPVSEPVYETTTVTVSGTFRYLSVQ